jgi:hypothetical protein
MRGSSQHVSCRVGFWVAIAAVLFIVSWRLCVIACQRHLLAVATEVGSIAQSKEEMINEELVPSSDGHGLIFFQETETGLGTYFYDNASGNSKLLFEQRENGFNGFLGSVAWSPDNRLLACAFKNDADPQHPKREIDIYDGISGETVLKIDALWDSRFIWLSSSSFAYTKHNGAWLVFKHKPDGNWLQTQVVRKFGRDDYLYNLMAISPHAVAWEQENEVWTHDLTTGVETKIWPAINTLYGFTYDGDTGDFLLNSKDESGLITIRFRPPRLGEKQGTILETNRDYGRTRHVNLHIEQGLYSFTIMTGTNSESIRFVWDGMVEYYKLAGDYVYFTGNRANGPPGIWQYNIKSKEARSLDSGLKRKFKYTKMVTPIGGMVTNAEGKQMNYHVWTPAHVSPGKKYPLIIGQTHYMWFSYQQVAANGGYYFASADRLSWLAGLDDWGADVMGLYEILAKNPNIDTNRVYLFATSAESRYLSLLVSEKPDLWKGFILFNPVAKPDLSSAHLSRMFIVGGIDDGNAVEWLTKYQDEAARDGIPVKLILQDGVQHITRSIATERERTRQFARFLMEN